MLSPCLFVVHDTLSSGEDDVAELSGWKNVGNNLLEVIDLDVESRRDDTALVESSVQLNNDLAGSLIVNDFKLVDVA